VTLIFHSGQPSHITTILLLDSTFNNFNFSKSSFDIFEMGAPGKKWTSDCQPIGKERVESVKNDIINRLGAFQEYNVLHKFAMIPPVSLLKISQNFNKSFLVLFSED
jgi:hypothetical protein